MLNENVRTTDIYHDVAFYIDESIEIVEVEDAEIEIVEVPRTYQAKI
jgi:hypothetical protein